MKKKLISLAVVFAVALNIFIIPAFAYEFDSSDGTASMDSISLPFADARSFAYAYMEYSGQAFIDMDLANAHYVYSRWHLSDSENANYRLLLINSPSTSATWNGNYLSMDNIISVYQFNINVQLRSGSNYIIRMNSWYHLDYIPLESTDTILATDLSITRDGEEVIEPDIPPQFSATITYDSDSDFVNFYINNLSDNTTFGFACGITGYQDFGLSAVGPGLDYTRSVPLQSVIDWAEDHNSNYETFTCWLTVYDGIDVADHQELTLSAVLSGGDGDDMYDEKLDYLPLPDYSDYVDWADWPEFPSLTPFPSFPGFDPSDPWGSLFDILQWIGQCILVPFQNLFVILQWVAELIKEFGSKLGHTFLWLKDVFWTLIQNIGIALHNLVVDMRALLMRLFVPRSFIVDRYIDKYFPIIEQSRDFFSSLTITGSNSISIPLHISGGGGTMNVSAITLGASNCAILYNISTYIILFFCLFSFINLFSAFAGLYPGSNVGGGNS